MRSIVDAVLRKTKTGGIALATVAALTLVGCGGGDSVVGGGTTTVTGQFVDAPVEGLGYKCGASTTLTAYTNSTGMFTCNTDDKVAFYVGNLLLGSVNKIQALVTPLDLVSTSSAVGTNNPTVTNIVRFLMSISSTLPDSGKLTIDKTVFDAIAAKAQTIDFASATTTLGDLIAAVKSGATIYTDAQAKAHLEKSVNALFAGDYSGSFGGSASGTWSITISATGVVTGTATDSGSITGNMIASSGTASNYAFTGTSGDVTWIGTLNLLTKQFSGTWNGGGGFIGTFTGAKQAAPVQPPANSGGGGGTLIVSGISPTTGNGNFSLPIAVETAAGGTSTDKRVEFTDATTATRTLRLYYAPGTGTLKAIQYNSPAGNLGCFVDDVVAPCDTTKITFSASGKSILLDLAAFKSGTTANGVLEGYFTW